MVSGGIGRCLSSLKTRVLQKRIVDPFMIG